jgi:hypothetical protein
LAPCLAASAAVPMTIAPAPSTTALALPAVTMPPASNAAGSRAILASVTSSRMWVSWTTSIGVAGAVLLDRHRPRSPRGTPRRRARPWPGSASEAERVGLLAGDLVATAQLLGGVGHRHARRRVVQAHQQHVLQVRARGQRLGVDRSVLLDRLAELLAAHAVERKRVLHALGAADHDEGPRVIVAQAAEDQLGADRHRLGAAAADARHGQRGDGLVEAAAPGHAARAVDRVAVAVLGHAHHDVADQAAVELGVRQRAGDGEAAELRGREPAEQARLACC